MTDRSRRPKLRIRPNPDGLWSEESTDQQRLDRTEIVRVALELLERQGVDAFSMRGLATALNIKSPSLYWHVRSKDELFDLVVDAVLGECVLPEHGTESDWREQLAEIAREMRRVLLRHPAATRLLNGRVPLGPNWLRIAESVIGTLRRAQFGDRLAGYCYLVLLYYAVGFVSQEVAFGQGVEGRVRLDQMREYFAGLPGDRYPNVTAVAGGLAERGLSDRFELGLNGILTGFAAELAAEPIESEPAVDGADDRSAG